MSVGIVVVCGVASVNEEGTGSERLHYASGTTRTPTTLASAVKKWVGRFWCGGRGGLCVVGRERREKEGGGRGQVM